ncbi:lysozyme inhibitor LprI family protein [Burkholderia paludis]|uniref:lysozyme inhibitor LprI family protein n=1 Tax=Burkholderia paludis TaxID=1506587 RepID=UPI001269F9BC|nr:lysozyme inhibitor LprI family protein [Burkholderia paludis]
MRATRKRSSGLPDAGAPVGVRGMPHAAKVLFVWSAMTWASGSFAAGLDCAAASSGVEKLICANPSLTARDAALNRLYGWTIADAAPIDKQKLTTIQKQWIGHVRDVCTTAACVGDAYDARIKALASIRFDGGSATYVRDVAAAARVTRQIQQDLRKVGITQSLGACSRIVSLDSHPDSYGALCDLGSQRPVQVCDEDRVGNLAVNFYGFSETGGGLAAFTQAVCPGG